MGKIKNESSRKAIIVFTLPNDIYDAVRISPTLSNYATQSYFSLLGYLRGAHLEVLVAEEGNLPVAAEVYGYGEKSSIDKLPKMGFFPYTRKDPMALQTRLGV
jgi:hypothetical protein